MKKRPTANCKNKALLSSCVSGKNGQLEVKTQNSLPSFTTAQPWNSNYLGFSFSIWKLGEGCVSMEEGRLMHDLIHAAALPSTANLQTPQLYKWNDECGISFNAQKRALTLATEIY